MLIYITGLSGSGKSTIAKELQKNIPNSVLLDGDDIRSTVNKDLGFTRPEKIENIRRNNALIKLLYDQEITVVCAFMSSISSERDKVFKECPNNLKIQLSTPLEVCTERDVKGLYKTKPKDFAGVTSKYEELEDPDIVLDTSKISLKECISKINANL